MLTSTATNSHVLVMLFGFEWRKQQRQWFKCYIAWIQKCTCFQYSKLSHAAFVFMMTHHLGSDWPQTLVTQVIDYQQISTHCRIPAPNPALFRVCRVQWNCCWLCAGTSSRLTGDQPTSRTSSAQSHIQPTGTEWWLWVVKETQLRLKTSDSASVLTCSKYNGLSSHLFGGEVLVLAPVFSTISHLNFSWLIIILLWDFIQ